MISIHAPTGGATISSNRFHNVLSISIHAPTGGATTSVLWFPYDIVISIHAPTGGATTMRRYITARQELFQSTLPRGERPYHNGICAQPIIYFNPRSHGGSDEDENRIRLSDSAISIHAPTGGATEKLGIKFKTYRISIHAPTGGATIPGLKLDGTPLISIHAPTGGATAKVTKFK